MLILPPSEPARRRRRNQPNSPASLPILPDELITEVLSFLDVKSLLKIRCVSKSLKSLISDPTFVQLHLKRSERNSQAALYTHDSNGCASVIPFPICSLLDNPLNTLPTKPCYKLMNKDGCRMVGSCNGLICLQGFHYTTNYEHKTSWFRLWNPATRKVSKKLGYFSYNSLHVPSFEYMFGYDNSSSTYKVVALHSFSNSQNQHRLRTDVKVLSLGDNVWKVVQSSPLVPFPFLPDDTNCGVDFRGSLNWLSLPYVVNNTCIDLIMKRKDVVLLGKLVINSFDLATETCTQFLPPPSFRWSLYIVPHIRVLVDCLCFCHDVERTQFLIWKMTEFKVQESWTQFLKISYQNIYRGYDFCDWKKDLKCHLTQLRLPENSDTLIFSNRQEGPVIFFNWRDNTVKETRITQNTWWCSCRNYVESLVSPC